MTFLFWWLVVAFALDIVHKICMLGLGEIPQRTPCSLSADVIMNIATLIAIIALWK